MRSHLKLSGLTNIFITHMHPDHVFGLPGLVLAALARREATAGFDFGAPVSALSEDVLGSERGVEPLTVYGPPGVRNFLRGALGAALPRFRKKGILKIVELNLPKESWQNRMTAVAARYWTDRVRRLPFEMETETIEPRVDEDGAITYDVKVSAWDGMRDGLQIERRPAQVRAGLVKHTIPCLAYEVTEAVPGLLFSRHRIEELGLPMTKHESGRDFVFNKLKNGESVEWKGRDVSPKDVARKASSPRRICICGDTSDASGVEHLARNVDVLVHEATQRAADADKARKRGHSSSTSAAAFAKRVGAKRLVMNHVSVAYGSEEVEGLQGEAQQVLGEGKAFVAHDLSVFSLPRRGREAVDQSHFRTFLGYPRLEYSDFLAHLTSENNARLQLPPLPATRRTWYTKNAKEIALPGLLSGAAESSAAVASKPMLTEEVDAVPNESTVGDADTSSSDILMASSGGNAAGLSARKRRTRPRPQRLVMVEMGERLRRLWSGFGG